VALPPKLLPIIVTILETQVEPVIVLKDNVGGLGQPQFKVTKEGDETQFIVLSLDKILYVPFARLVYVGED
jgi:hypothetical protein